MLRVGPLPEEPLAAAAHFHVHVLPPLRDALGSGADCVLVFDPADYTHRDWRNSVVRGLAREYAPIRVNAVSGDDKAAIGIAIEYLASASGVTGQLLPIVGQEPGALIA